MKLKGSKILILALLFIVVCGFLIYLISKDSSKVRKFKVERKKMILSVYASGYIDSSDSVNIKPEVSGYIEKIFVRENQEVKKGQILAVINHNVLKQNLREVDAILSDVEEKLRPQSEFRNEQLKMIEIKKVIYENLERNFQRKKALYEEELLSKEKFDDLKREYEVAKKEYERQISLYNDSLRSLTLQREALRAKRQALKEEIERHIVRAPIDGKILRKFVNQGDYVNNLQQGNFLFTVGNDKNLETVLMVDEEYIPMIKEDMKVIVTIDSYPNDSFIGKIKLIESQSDRSSRTVKVKAHVDYTKPVIFGLTVEANIITKEIEGIFIPVSALKEGYVEVVERGKSKKVKVDVAPERYNGFFLVKSGLKEGQEILIK